LKNAEETLRTADGTAAAPSSSERAGDDERPDDEAPF